jgi:ABC-type branched-subunit amino acid transport system ATPase component
MKGRILFADRDLKAMTQAAIACGGVVQYPECRELFGAMSVRENLDIGGQQCVESRPRRQGAGGPVPRFAANPGQSPARRWWPSTC